ncbi:MAG: hypothetical protein JWO07_390 [Candidatus Saccharibacteria bacterium]|nr:hypothetical protein [Candidatus Saccharibacteria bacterium]
MQRMSTNIQAKGFTIVELVIVITVSGLLLGMLVGPLTDLYYANTTSLNTILVTADAKTALRTVANDVTIADNFYSQNTVSDPASAKGDASTTQWTTAAGYDYSGYNGAGQVNNRVLILGEYATTKTEAQDTYVNIAGGGSPPTRQVYLKTGCTTPIENNIIYYVKNSTLYRRTIPDNTTAKCTAMSSTYSIAQKQSCPTGLNNALCKSNDAIIATSVDQFSIDYYLHPYDTSPMTYGSDPTTATSVYITLKVHTGTGSQLITSTSNLLMTRINGANT